MASSIIVRAEWDDEAKVWVATSEDIPGLATEADTMEVLRQKLHVMIPELIEANGLDFALTEIPLHIVTHQFDRVRNPSAA